MASFVKLGIGNIVLKGESVSNDIATTEQAGVDFLNNLYNTRDIWKQTSYNTNSGVHSLGGTPFRKNFAGVGFTYDETRDAFLPPKPYKSWTLNEETCHWESPVDYPNDGELYIWNELSQRWDLQD